MSYLHKALLKQRESRPPHRQQSKDYTPLSWEKYFNEYKDVTINSDVFRVYICGENSPTLVLLHGGGYSALTWSLFSQELINRVQCRILAIDIRGHGVSHTSDDENLSIETITTDIVDIIDKMCGNTEPIILVGHSMGGALAVHCAHKLQNCVGLCVIDVVEGTALESLASMQSFLRNRPTSFINIEHAIQWCYRSGQTQNLESARISMPGQIKNTITNKLAAIEVAELLKSGGVIPEPNLIEEQLSNQTASGIPTISEENTVEEEPDNHVIASMEPPSSYSWRINLSKTEVYWKGWFQGLSELFLNATVPKMLLLANIHGLDTALTVGQMQGKFQMQVLPRCGHAIHEDLPDKVADIIASFLVRQKLSVAVSDFSPMFPAC